MMDLTVFTPSLPSRREMLLGAMASVAAQTFPPAGGHHVEVDHARAGVVAVANRLAEQVDTEWLMLLDDDDLLDPNHCATLATVEDADIVYTWTRVTGRPGFDPNATFDADALRAANYIPGGCAAIRTSLWRELGGYRPGHDPEDWDFWLRALDVGARFVCIPKITWTYRFGPWGNLSIGTL